MDLAVMTGAGGTIDLGGKTLLLSPMTLQDVGFVKRWLQERIPHPFSIVSEALQKLRPAEPEPQPPRPPKAEKDMTGEEAVAWAQQKADYAAAKVRWDRLQAEYAESKKLLLLNAVEDSKGEIPIDGAAAQTHLNSLEGVAFLLWLAARKNHPELASAQDVQRLLEAEDLAAVKARLDAVNSLGLPEADDDPNPKAARPTPGPSRTGSRRSGR